MLDADFHGAPKLTTKPLLVMTPTADKVDLRGAFFSGRRMTKMENGERGG